MRAMIAAAHADGRLDDDERRAILDRLDASGFGDEEKGFVLQHLDNPVPMESVIPREPPAELAQQIFAVSLLAIDVDSAEERSYMDRLAMRLGVDPGARRFLERAIDLCQGDGCLDVLLEHSQVCLESGDHAASLKSLEAVEKIVPGFSDTPWIQVRRGQSLLALGRNDEAHPLLESALRSAASDDRERARELMEKLPKSYRQTDEKAAKLVEKSAKKLGKEPREALELAQQAYELGSTPEVRMALAKAHLRIALELEGTGAARPHYEEGLYQLRVCRLSDPHGLLAYTDAKGLTASQLVRIQPLSEEAGKKYLKAEAAFNQRKWREAAELYREVNRIEPDFAKAYLHLGDCFFANNQFNEALSYYVKAARTAPLDASTYRFAADALRHLERIDEVHRLVMESLLADPDYPLVWMEIKQWASDVDRPCETHKEVVPLRLLTLRPSDDYEGLFADLPAATVPAWRAYVNRKLLWRQEDFAKEFPSASYYRATVREEVLALQAAADQWDAMRQADGDLRDDDLDFIRQVALDDRLDAFVQLELFGEEYRPEFEAWKQQHRDVAQAYLDDYVFGGAQQRAADGFNSSAFRDYNEATRLYDSDPEKAVELYRHALRQEPRMEKAAGNLAQLLYGLKRYEEVEAVAKRWAEIDPDSFRPYDLLSVAMAGQQRWQEAAELAEKALALVTDEKNKERLQRNLEVFRARLR